MHTSQGVEEIVDSVLAASRVLIGVAIRSLPEGSDVTMHQFRALALLQAHDEMTVTSLAGLLGVGPSTVTRLCDRLVRKGLIRRRHGRQNRRVVCISISPSGGALVDEVLSRRRAEIAAIVADMPPGQHGRLAGSLRAFVAASGEEVAIGPDVA